MLALLSVLLKSDLSKAKHMIERSRKLGPLLDTMLPYLPIKGFDPFNWIMFDKNIALTDGKGNYSLYEYVEDGVYDGHMFFKTARGKEALEVGKEMLDHLFSNYEVDILRGFTPMSKKGALWVARNLGFKDVGTTEFDGEINQKWAMTPAHYERKKRNGQ